MPGRGAPMSRRRIQGDRLALSDEGYVSRTHVQVVATRQRQVLEAVGESCLPRPERIRLRQQALFPPQQQTRALHGVQESHQRAFGQVGRRPSPQPNPAGRNGQARTPAQHGWHCEGCRRRRGSRGSGGKRDAQPSLFPRSAAATTPYKLSPGTRWWGQHAMRCGLAPAPTDTSFAVLNQHQTHGLFFLMETRETSHTHGRFGRPSREARSWVRATVGLHRAAWRRRRPDVVREHDFAVLRARLRSPGNQARGALPAHRLVLCSRDR